MIVCADDYGLSDSIDDAVIELIQKNRLTATSCMVNGQNVKKSTSRLKEYLDKIDVGLHLLLTDGKPLSNQKTDGGLVDQNGNLNSFWMLTTKAYFQMVQFKSASNEIRAQIERFHDLFGRMPDFIDGHKHVQQLPVMRNSLAKVIKDMKFSPYLRIAALPDIWMMNTQLHFSKKMAIDNMIINYPGTGARKLFIKHGFHCNRYLLGYYHGSCSATFSEIFRLYTKVNPVDKDIFFCHPGHEEKHRIDSLQFLVSSEFDDICSARSISLNRFPRSLFQVRESAPM
jgi:chitin disaccharide deacetylase